MILAESQLSQSAAQETLPLRDAFAVLFFVSVGMLVDPSVLLRQPFLVAVTVLIIVAGNIGAVFAIARLFGHPLQAALTLGLTLSQIAEFPGLSGSALQGGCILQGLYDKGLLDKEYQDTRVLYMFTTGPGTLHTRNKSVPNPDALKGLRMRNPSAIAGQVLQEAGARNVSMPAPEAYESMQRGVIDGTAFPWEAMQVFRLNELATHHTDVAIYSTAFVTAMNKNSYDRLPDDLKKVLDEHSGAEWQRKAAAVFDALDVEGREFAQKAGHEIIKVEDPMNDPEWKPVLQTVIDNYLADLKKQNNPGEDVYAAARELKAQCPLTAG